MPSWLVFLLGMVTSFVVSFCFLVGVYFLTILRSGKSHQQIVRDYERARSEILN